MITDKDYLKHMIPHHKVAVVMAKNLEQSTNSPTMMFMAWQIIWYQEFEIAWMQGMLQSGIPSITHTEKIGEPFTPGNIINCYYPKKSQDLNIKSTNNIIKGSYKHTSTKGPMFNPKLHENKKITDKDFLIHMIPHHQIAINMSKELLKCTKDTRMIELAYKIIGSQQYEIWVMKGMLKKLYLFHSPLLSTKI